MQRKNENVRKMVPGRNTGNVYLTRDGFIRKIPDISSRITSEQQTTQDQQSYYALVYCVLVMICPKLFDFYRRFLNRMKTRDDNVMLDVWQIAVMDYMAPPEILEVKMGRTPEHLPELLINARDVLYPPVVMESFIGPGYEPMDEDQPTQLMADNLFHYTIKDSDLLHPGILLYVEAKDKPGNFTEREFDMGTLEWV